MARELPMYERRVGLHQSQVSGSGAVNPVQPAGVSGLMAIGNALDQASGVAAKFMGVVQNEEAKTAQRESAAAGSQYGLDTELADIQLPTGNSVGEEAFRKSAIVAASAKADMAAREDIEAVAKLHPGQPEAFKAAITERSRAFLAKLPPDMQPAVAETYGRLQYDKYLALDDERKQFVVDQSRATLVQQTSVITMAAAKRARAGDMQGALAEMNALAAAHGAAGPVALGGSGALTLTQIEESTLKAKEEIQGNFLDGWVERTPNKSAALAGLKRGHTGNPVVDGVLAVTHPDTVDKLANHLEAEINRRQAKADAAQTLRLQDLRDQASDAVEMMNAGVPVAGVEKLHRAILAEGPRGAPLAEKLGGAIGTAAYAENFALKPLPDQIAEVDGLQTELKDLRDKGGDVSQSAATFTKLQTAAKVVKADLAALDEGRALDVAAARGLITVAPVDPTDPASVANRVSAAKAASEHFGTRVPIVRPAEVASIAGGVSKMLGEEQAAYFSQMQAAAGDAYPDFIRDLTVKGGLDRKASTIAVLAGRPDAADVVNAVGEALSVDPKDLKPNLDRAQVSEAEVDRLVATRLSDWAATVGATYKQGSVGGGAAAFIASTTETVKLTAMTLMRTRGVDEAVNRAADAIINDRYEYRDTYRIPRPAVGGQAAIDKIDTAIASTMAALSPDLVDPRGSPEGVSEQTRRAAYFDSVRSTGTWSNLPDESGLVLTDQDGNAVTVKGRPVLVKF